MIIKPKKIGIVSRQIIDILQLNIKTNTPIFIGESNIKHIIEKHRTDYEKYGIYIEEILSAPDYVGVNNKEPTPNKLPCFWRIVTSSTMKRKRKKAKKRSWIMYPLSTLI